MTMCGLSGGPAASEQRHARGYRPKKDCRAAAYLNSSLQPTARTLAAAELIVSRISISQHRKGTRS